MVFGGFSWINVLVAAILSSTPFAVNALSNCGDPYDQEHGPFDYRDSSYAVQLRQVETYHFYREVESAALQGRSRPTLVGDLDFALRHFPNHPRALVAMATYQMHLRRRSESDYLNELRTYRSAECYFERAKSFVPDDPNVHNSYGIYLHRKGDLDAALAEFKKAGGLSPENRATQYNLGLIYLAMKRYDESRHHAHRAYELGAANPALRNKLRAVGKW